MEVFIYKKYNITIFFSFLGCSLIGSGASSTGLGAATGAGAAAGAGAAWTATASSTITGAGGTTV